MNEELANGYFTGPQDFAQKAHAAGYKWVAYQWNDETHGPVQRSLANQTRQMCQLYDLAFTVWLTRPFDAGAARHAVLASGCYGIILEGEIPSEWKNPSTGKVEPYPSAVNWEQVVHALEDLPIPKAIVSNQAPFVHANGLPWPEKAKPLVDAGYAYITECFVSETPTATPERTDFYVTTHLGWPETQPMIEGWHVEDYGDLSRFRNVSHWDAGNVL